MEFVYLFAAFVGIALLWFLSYIIDNEDDLVCKIITYTIHPKMFVRDCLNTLIMFGIITLVIYLLYEYTWVIVTLIATLMFCVIIFCWNDHTSEMNVYKKVIQLLEKGYYEIAENVLRQEAKDRNAKEVGKLHSPLLDLIRFIKEKEEKREPKVWNINIYAPIQEYRALVPISHYQTINSENNH